MCIEHVGKSLAHYTWVCWRWPRQLGWEVCNTRLDGACLESGRILFGFMGIRLRLSYHTGTQIEFHKSMNHCSKFTVLKIVLLKHIFWESWWYSCQTLGSTPTTTQFNRERKKYPQRWGWRSPLRLQIYGKISDSKCSGDDMMDAFAADKCKSTPKW